MWNIFMLFYYRNHIGIELWVDLGDGIKNYIIARMLYELVNPAVLLWDDYFYLMRFVLFLILNKLNKLWTHKKRMGWDN